MVGNHSHPTESRRDRDDGGEKIQNPKSQTNSKVQNSKRGVLAVVAHGQENEVAEEIPKPSSLVLKRFPDSVPFSLRPLMLRVLNFEFGDFEFVWDLEF